MPVLPPNVSRAALLSLALAALAASVHAQSAPPPAPAVVRGVVYDSVAARYVGGLTVRVVDAAGASVGGAMSDGAGRFVLRVAPGRYVLRVQRVGFRSTATAPLAVRADTTLRLAAPSEPVSIAPVQTVGRAECALRGGERGETADLWEEARKALDAAALARAQQQLRLTVTDFVRELDASGTQLRSERRTERSGTGLTAYRSRDPDSLALQGYVRPDGDAIWYYTPDADVLLSPSFARTHCFRLERDPARPELAGLAFEPVRGRREADVRGVLWVDRATRELRSLDYTYSSYPETRWPQAAGGHVDFARLPSGAWMLRRWTARAPILQQETRYQTQGSQGGNPMSTAAPRFTSRRETDLVGVREHAGEVQLATTLDGTPLFARELGALEGTVTDSATGAPLAGARVALVGTGRLTVANDFGHFRLDSVPVGGFGVTFSHPALDTLAIDPLAWRVTVRRGETTPVRLALPPLATLKARACAADFGASAAQSAVVGVVTDGASGVPVPDALVTVAWSTFERQAAGTVLVENVRQATAAADAQGQYRVCTVPGDTRLTVQAAVGERTSAPVVLEVGAGKLARRDVVVRE